MNKTRILVVEDEIGIADTILYALRTEGFGTLHATTGEECLVLFEAHRPDLLILDVGLPDTTGFEVCRELRRHTEVPIIFLTARDAEVDRVVGLEIGADDYVVKPFSPRELTARVRARLRRKPSEQKGGASRTDGFEINETSFCVALNGRDLELTRYEFRLFKVLIARPGQVYSREQLLTQVWDHPEEVVDRSVDTHIKTLRQKIRQIDAGRDPIRTHRGLGYSWKAEKG